MEKITLKPIAKELLVRTDDPGSHVDVFTYAGTNSQERALGSLYLIGQAAYGEEDLGYVINLAASLARREYYSSDAVKGQDPKKAFEGTLKKLNEVLEDFFKNDGLQLNLGLAAIAGETMYVSKLGKFKVSLARNGEQIDVLNNLMLFQKDPEQPQRFSHVISGRIFPGDKIFAYFPSRAITSRERMLQGVLAKETQGGFAEKIAQLASVADGFSCCGVHIAVDQVKEIPLESAEHIVEKPRVIAAELSVSRKTNMLAKAAGMAATMRGLQRFAPRRKLRWFAGIAAMVLVPLIAVALIRSAGSSSSAKAAYREASESLGLAKQRIAERDLKAARAFLYAAIGRAADSDDTKLRAVKEEAIASLQSLDKVQSTVPVRIGVLTEDVGTNRVLEFDAQGVPTVLFNGAESLMVKSKTYTLKDPATATSAALFESNLYTLSAGHIYKYADALTGGTKRSDWGTLTDDVLSIAVDGNLYAFTKSGAIAAYFKGERKSAFDTNLAVQESSILLTTKDSTLLFVLDPALKRLYAFDKQTGALTASYVLDAAGTIKDAVATPSNDGAGYVWLLSEDHSIWKLSTAVQP